MTETSKALKVGGAWAGIATVVAALSTAVVQVRPVLNDLALADAGKLELEEIRRHAIDQPVKYEMVGTSRGVVSLSVFETGCVRVASANRLRSLPAQEHEQIAERPVAHRQSLAAFTGFPVEVGAAPPCNASPDGQCAIPAEHPTWDWQEMVGQDAGGFLLLDLIWDHGCRLRARYNPQTGEMTYMSWQCCAHG